MLNKERGEDRSTLSMQVLGFQVVISNLVEKGNL
jgi:hypothetical protein